MAHAILIRLSNQQQDNPVVVPTPGPPDWVNVVPQRVQEIADQFQEVLTDQKSPVQEVEDMDGNKSMRGMMHFAETEDKTNILDRMEGKFADAKWYEIWSHDCKHDHAIVGPCGAWQLEREG